MEGGNHPVYYSPFPKWVFQEVEMKQFIINYPANTILSMGMACHPANEAVDNIVSFLNEHPAMKSCIHWTGHQAHE